MLQNTLARGQLTPQDRKRLYSKFFNLARLWKIPGINRGNLVAPGPRERVAVVKQGDVRLNTPPSQSRTETASAA